jgi:Zn-dependent M28 family amino/carboxypeptidase
MTAHAHRLLTTAAVLLAFALGSPSALAQVTGAARSDSAARQQRPAPNPTRGVLGGVPMTAADSAIKAIVDRLDFTNYKAIIKGLTQFGDREQGTKRNEDAVTWIEQQLQSWGYTTERVKYDFRDSPREQVFATKIGSTVPQEMYILGGHMDGRGGGEAANDDASGTALVMEIARVLAASDVTTTRSVRFALWNNEETGLNGARAYVAQRASLQGIETPARSGKYPEPKWLGMIQHDMMMWDHGNPVQHQQVLDADVDIEFQLNSAKAEESAALAVKLLNANRLFATDYPAAMSNAMSNTDSGPFQDLVPSVSLRENRRLYETGRGANPHWHRATDLYVTFSDADFRLGFNAAQTTLGAVARLVEAKIK